MRLKGQRIITFREKKVKSMVFLMMNRRADPRLKVKQRSL